MKHTKGIIIVSTASLFYLYMFFVRVMPGGITHILMHDLSISSQTVGYITTSFVLAYALCQIPAGLIVDKIGAKKTMVAAMGGCIIGTYLFQSVDSWRPLLGDYAILIAILSRVILGISCSAAFIAPVKLIKQWLPTSYFSAATGMVQVLGCIGAMLNAPIALVIQNIGWKDATLGTTFIAMILLGLFAFVIQENKEQPSEKMKADSPIQVLYNIFTHTQYWKIGLIAISSWAIIGGFTEAWGITYLSKLQSISMAEATKQASWTWVSVAIISPLGGYWFTHSKTSRLPILCLQVIGTIAFILIISGHIVEPTQISLLLFIMGVSAGTQPIAFGLINKITPKHMLATAVSFCNVCVIAGAFIIQPIISTIIGTLSTSSDINLVTLQWSFIPIIIFMFLGIIIALNVDQLRIVDEN